MKCKIKFEKTKELPQTSIRIIKTSHSEVTREADPDEKYDGDDISYDHEIEGYEVVSSKDSWDFVINEDPKGIWYLVYALYDTGDSFHREENCISLISFVKNIEDASAIFQSINDDYKKYQEKQDHEFKPLKVHLPIANKTEEIYTATWKGYFERLKYVEVKGLGNGLGNGHKVIFSSKRRF